MKKAGWGFFRRWALGLGLASCLLAGWSPARAASPDKLWERKFTDEVRDVAIATQTGAVAVSTDSAVSYYGDGKDPVWTAGSGQGWKLVADLGVSWDGSRVFFQTDQKPKTSTEGRDLTMHLVDGAGAELWARPNPMRYQNARFSPSGKYLMLGEATQVGVGLYTTDLTLVWEKEMRFWQLMFDPRENYLFDGEAGVLYRVTGEQVWDFGSTTRANSLSDDAAFLLTQYYRTVKAGEKMFLTGRDVMKKIELPGAGGCVSPDGSLTAVVNLDKKLAVYRTLDLLNAGGPGAEVLFEAKFLKPWVIQIARDNRTLFVMGKESESSSVMMLVDLAGNQTAWKKSVDDRMRVALPTEDNRYVVIKPDKMTVAKYRCYQ